MTRDVSNYGDLTSLFRDAGLISKEYPVKGCYVWKPYGMEIKNRVLSAVHDQFERRGYEEHQFPRLTPGDAIRTVADEIEDFQSGTYWLRTSDGTKTDIFLTPTGECSVYTMFRKWIRHESDLPIRLYQHGPIFRSHTDPRPILSGDEVTDLVEAHSAFATSEAATEEFERSSNIFDDLFAEIGIPTLPLKRPQRGNNPVYEEMYSYETYLPSRRRSCNAGCLYNQQQIFSKALNISFADQNGDMDNTYQVTFGVSERIIAIMLDLHRDEHGLRILPEFAPTQVRIIPVYGGIENETLDKYSREIKSELNDGSRVDIDDRDTNAGKRLAEARLMGIPIRIGISAGNYRDRNVRVFLRTRSDPRCGIAVKDLSLNLSKYLRRIREDIIYDSKQIMDCHVQHCETLEDARNVADQGDAVRLFWCGNSECFDCLDDTLPGELLGRHADPSHNGECIVCGAKDNPEAYFGKRVSA